jgi:serralysin
MNLSKIKMCRECKKSYSRELRNLKNAIRENYKNMPKNISQSQKGQLEDYVFKNVVKSPEHMGNIARMVMPKVSMWTTDKNWKNGRVLTVSFLEGQKKIKDAVKKHAREWMDYCSIELVFKTSPKKPTDIRIAFNKKDGSWSYVGTDLLEIPADEPTMNFGWFDASTDDEEYNRTVLHEFGHSLGCAHEHSSPKGGIPWDKKKAYAYYMEDGWTKEEVDEQVFKKYSLNAVRGTKIDKTSIMMYPIPNDITIGDYEVGWNTELSPDDKKFINKVYPKKK